MLIFIKVLQEASTKDNRISFLDGQLSKLRNSLETESSKVAKLTVELERSVVSGNKNHELLEQKEQGMHTFYFENY